MRIRNYKKICFILTIFLLFSVMGLDSMKADTSFGCAPMEKIHCYLLSVDSMQKEIQISTTEMLSIYNNAVMQQLTGKLFNKNRETGVSLDFLSSNKFSISEGSLSAGLRGIQYLYQRYNQLVINYIHNSDGKKRS